MGVDLHRIGIGISSGNSRNGFGNIVSFPSVPAGFPPYGTILSTGSEPVTSSFTYGESPYTTGSFTWGSFPAYTRADGSGGSYLDLATGYSLGTETIAYNTSVNDDVNQVNTRIIYKGGYGFTEASAGTWSECLRYGVATGNFSSGNVTANIEGTDYATGYYTTYEYGNGTCGVYTDTTYDYSSYTYGTYFLTLWDNAAQLNYDYYYDGAGGYYSIVQP